MIASNVSTLAQSKRDTGGLENAQVRARLESARTIARIIHERMAGAPKERTKTSKSRVLKYVPGGLGTLEGAQWLPALRENGAGSLLPSATPTRAIGLRGLEQTQCLEAWRVRGTVVDRVV